MNLSVRSLATLATFLATIVTRSQTPTDDFDPLGVMASSLPRMIRVHAEFIEMPEPIYTKLMSQPRTSANDTALRAECAELIAAGTASVLESLCVTALPGQAATSESIAEYIYPTEYEPGQIPEKVNGEAPPQNTAWGSPPTPSAFDTKNTGSTFEVEAQIDANDGIVELRFTPTLVYHVGNENWGAEKISGASGPIEMAKFYVLAVKTGASVIPGQPTMIAALSPKNEQGYTDSSRKVMVFIRADILVVGK